MFELLEICLIFCNEKENYAENQEIAWKRKTWNFKCGYRGTKVYGKGNQVSKPLELNFHTAVKLDKKCSNAHRILCSFPNSYFLTGFKTKPSILELISFQTLQQTVPSPG